MIFITVGSQKFQFDRLLKEMDELVREGIIKEEVYAQIGYSEYVPQCYEYVEFLDRETFARKVEESSTLITHGGTGVIVGALKKGKKVIAVPRLAKYGEHVDDHQLQLLEQFSESGMIIMCEEVQQISGAINQLQEMQTKEYKSNTKTIIKSIQEFIKE